jgi:hypothetical protein
MSALSADNPRKFEAGHDEFPNELLVSAGVKIYEGSFVGIIVGTGYARALVAGDAFAGVCTEAVDNTNGASGDVRVKVKGKCVLSDLAVTGVAAVTDQGATVYFANDNDATLTVGSNSLGGKILRRNSGTACQVLAEALSVRSL